MTIPDQHQDQFVFEYHEDETFEIRRSSSEHFITEAADAAVLAMLAVVGAAANAILSTVRTILLVLEAGLRFAAGMDAPADDPELANLMTSLRWAASEVTP